LSYSAEETESALDIYGSEILVYEDTYPGRSARASLSYLLQNENQFFFKKGHDFKAVKSMHKLMMNSCKSPFSTENLSILRD
jgi:hypothetical protein